MIKNRIINTRFFSHFKVPVQFKMNNTSLSGQGISYEFHPAFLFTCMVCYFLVIAISLVGNMLVCMAICLNKGLRSSPTMSFIFSLACSDFLTACLAMPFDAESLLLNGAWKHDEILCIVWTTAYLFTVPTSMLTLVALTVDRYKALSDPLRRFRKTKFLTVKRSRVMMVFLWSYCLAFSLIPIMGWRYYPSHVMNGYCYFNITPAYSVLSTVLHFFLPLLVIAGIYFKIYRIAMNVKNCHDLHEATNSSPSHMARHPTPRDHGNFQRKLKATKTIAIIICALFFCWFPFSVTSFAFSLCEQCYYNTPHVQELQTALLVLGYLNSALNPFIYSLRSRKFRETYHSLYLSIRKIARGTMRRSRLGSSSSQKSTSSITFSKRRHVSTTEHDNSVRLTAYTVSIKSQ